MSTCARPASSLNQMRQVAQHPDDAPNIDIIDVNGTAHPHKGKALFTDITVDEATGDVTMRVLVDNPDHSLLPGMFVRAVVPHESIKDALLVPQQAVSRDAEGNTSVVVVDESGSVANIQPVRLGELVGQRYLVVEGLEPNATVVVRGQTRVTQNGTNVVATPAAQAQQ